MGKRAYSSWDILRMTALGLFFAGAAAILYWIFSGEKALENKTEAQQLLFPLGLGLLTAALLTAAVAAVGKKDREQPPVWHYPLISALLTLAGLSVAYIFLGVWPVGEKTVMLVDMHHQYAPFLAKLREMLLQGENPFYSFEFGLGASVLPAAAYYLASPLNLLLLLFPARLLTEGIFFITLIKNMLIAAGAAACLQYIHRRRTPLIPAVALMYSMMMYVLAYSWNIMWLDVVAALPVAVLSFEHLMRRGKYLPYVLTLAYALYANYYIAFMLCAFLVLYWIAFLLRERRSAGENWRSFRRFALGSLLGGGLAMFLVLPTFMALGQTSAAASKMPEMNAYFPLFNLLGRHLYAVSPTIRSGNLPNVFCSVAPLILVPLFAMNRGIPRRRRAAYMGLLAVMTGSMVVNQFNLLWHGLHAPNDLPYRFSFIYCFVLLLMSYEALLHLRTVRMGQIFTALGMVFAFVMIEERFGGGVYDFRSLYVSLLLVLVYGALCWLIGSRPRLARSLSLVLLAAVTLEMTLNASRVFIKLNNQEYNTAHMNYVDNAEAEARYMAVGAMKARVGEEEFARMEFLPRHTCTDTALYQYPGITSFASSNSYRTTRFMGALGYDVNGVNSYMYRSFLPATDSLLGIRYVALKEDMDSHRQLTKLDSVTARAGQEDEVTYYIYENASALPLAYRVEPEMKTWASSYYNPAQTVNSLYTAMTGDPARVLVPAVLEVFEYPAGTAEVRGEHGFYFSPAGNDTVEFGATVDREGRYFAYVDCRAADGIKVYQGTNSWTVTPHQPYFIDLGTLQAGDAASAAVTSDSTCSGNVFILRLEETVYTKAMEKLKANGLQITSFSQTRIEGTVSAANPGVMFTSIPYDRGWSVTVDGKPVDTYPLDTALPGADDEADPYAGALLGFDLTAGSHTVVLTFRTRGFLPGVLLSVISLAALICVCLLGGRLKGKAAGTPLAWLADEDSLTALPADPEPEPPLSEEESAEAMPPLSKGGGAEGDGGIPDPQPPAPAEAMPPLSKGGGAEGDGGIPDPRSPAPAEGDGETPQ